MGGHSRSGVIGGIVLALAALTAACSGTPTPEAQPKESPPTAGSPTESSSSPSPARGDIVTVAGSGEEGGEGVGGPATEAQLLTPDDFAFDSAGNLYIAERYGFRVLKVDTSGILTVVAGNESGSSEDGIPATEVDLDGASAIAVGPDDNLYIADTLNSRILMVDQSGFATTIAGTGDKGFSGDGGPATQAELDQPAGMTFDAEGNLYFHDPGNFAVRMIDGNGIITTVAGGREGVSPDGTLATEARLGFFDDHLPLGLAFDRDGRLLITDMGNNRIWMIDEQGRLQTVAGNGKGSSSGDGGPATQAGVAQPLDIEMGPRGVLFIATHSHGGTDNRVRSVERDGTITTFAGTGEAGYEGDGGPATEAELDVPASVAIGPDGNLYIADAINNVIRMAAL